MSRSYRNFVPPEVDGKRRYSRWSGNPKGKAENTARCIVSVQPPGEWFSQQCSRKRGHGPGGMFCRQHAAIEGIKTTEDGK